MSTLQNFINDFLQSTTDEDPTQAGMGPVAPAAPPPPPPPPQPAPQTGRSKKRARDGADETASERADRKSARERRRRAEVGEKFEELTKALGEAEERHPHLQRVALDLGERILGELEPVHLQREPRRLPLLLHA